MKTGSSTTTMRVAAIAVPLLFLLTLVSWAFASPVGSSPDDNFHLPSIWCGLGDRPGLCEESGKPETRRVPQALLTAPCYAFKPAVNAACWNPTDEHLAEATWMNANGLYPPLFYATMSIFAGPDIQTSVIAMRIFNSALVVGLLTGVFFALPRRLRPALVLSMVVTSVPLGAFVIASTNPSSWALAGAATIWVSLFGATQTSGRRQLVLCGLAVVGVVIGAGARADAAVFAAFGVFLAAVLGARWERRMIAPAVAGLLVLVIGGLFYLSAGQASLLTAGLPHQRPPLSGAENLANLLDVPSLWLGAFDGLGWLDTKMPTLVTLLAFAVYAATAFLGIHRLTIRRGIAASVAFLALWVVPFALLWQSHATIGTVVQSRYILPVMIILIGVASAAPTVSAEWRGARSYAGAGLLSVAMMVALHENIRRYAAGNAHEALDPGAGASWWWPMAPSPALVWVLGSLAFAGALAILCGLLRPPRAASRVTEASTPGSERGPTVTSLSPADRSPSRHSHSGGA